MNNQVTYPFFVFQMNLSILQNSYEFLRYWKYHFGKIIEAMTVQLLVQSPW